MIGDVEAHIAALLNHVNGYTHVAYKNDPTILGWDLLNGGGSPTAGHADRSTSARIDSRHLILSGSRMPTWQASTRASASSTRTGRCRSPS